MEQANEDETLAGTSLRRLAVNAASYALNRFQHQYRGFSNYPYQERPNNTQDTFAGILPMLKRIFYYTVIAAFLFISSLATYGLIYLASMPSHIATESLFFDYTCRNDSACATHVYERLNNYDQSLDTSPRTCCPSATVDIFAAHTPWEALNPDVMPTGRTEVRVLSPRTHYFLEISLQLPESSINNFVGIFGIQVELQSKQKVPLARSKRSSRLPHESTWIAVVRKSLLLIPYLLGAITESKTIVVPSFRHFVESIEQPLEYIIVSLVPQGSNWHGDRPVEVISGELRIGKELNLLQNILKDWFWTCLILGTMTIFSMQVFVYYIANILWDFWRERTCQQGDIDEAPYFFDSDYAFTTTDPFEEDDKNWEAMPPPQDDVPHAVEEPEVEQTHVPATTPA